MTGFNMKDKLPPPPPLSPDTTKNGPEHLADNQVANFHGEANLDRVQRSGSVGNIEDHAGHDASGVPLEENILRRVFYGINSLKHWFWRSLSLLFLFLGEFLCNLGRNVGFPKGVLIFTIIAFLGPGFPGFFQTSKTSSIAPVEVITQDFGHGTNVSRLGMSSKPELHKNAIVLPKNLSSSIHQQVAPAEHFSWQHRMVDIRKPGTCPGAFPGNQSTVMEIQHLFRKLTSNYEGSKTSLPKSCKTCQELQSVNEALFSTIHIGQFNDTCGMKQDDHHLKAKVQSLSHQKAEKDVSEQFVDKKPGNFSQMFQGEVNGGLIQRSKNGLSHWWSHIKNYVSHAVSGDKLEGKLLQSVMNHVYSLKYKFWGLSLLLLVNVMFGFVGRRSGIVIGVTMSIILGFAISTFVMTNKNGLPSHPFQYDFATLMYDIAYSLMFLSLVLQQTHREWLSYLIAGSAYSCVILFILGHKLRDLPFNYACSCFAVLFVFVLFWKHSR